MAKIEYDAVLKACNPETDVSVDELDSAIREIKEAVFPGLSEEDVVLSAEDSELLATAVCHRLGIHIPMRVIRKRLLGLHK